VLYIYILYKLTHTHTHTHTPCCAADSPEDSSAREEEGRRTAVTRKASASWLKATSRHERGMRPSATSVSGLKLLVYEALSY
jgi:hypothetical protein